MRVPTNSDFYNFVYRYGYAVVVTVVVIMFLQTFVSRIIKTAEESKLASCTVNNLDYGTKLSYNGNLFRVETFDYSEYDYVNDTINIRLEQIKN
jgi:hypothetical protein